MIRFKKDALALLLVLAMLTVAFAAILPVAAAEPEPVPEEIQDFGYQPSADFAVAGATTEMQFVFTIGALDYTKVGFVFSFENYGNVAEPEIGEDGCYTVEAIAAYSAIIADGETLPAPDGRWWIVAKVINIPQTEYNSNIYVRAFVTDGEGTRYSVTKTIDPYTANREDGKIQEYAGTSISTQTYKNYQNIYTKVLQSGAKTFCPTQENPTGNDLYIEYSVLFSKYVTTTYLTDGAYLQSGVGHSESLPKALVYWDLCGSKSDDGFEDVGNFTGFAAEDPGNYPNMFSPTVYADKPHVGGDDANNPDYGWHRIGIVYHEEVTNVDAVKAGGDAEYYLTVSLYLDGDLVFVMGANDNTDGDNDFKLYTAEYDGNGGITYTDVAETDRDQSVTLFRLYRFKKGSKVGCCVFADWYATCGKSFVQRVTRVNDPVVSQYSTTPENNKLIDAPVYYRIVTDENLSPLLSVMSYNIEVYGGSSGNAMWDGRDPAKVAETVLAESPDIVGFQEVNQNNNNHGWDDTLNALATAGGYTRLEGGYTGRYNFEKNEIFYKTSKFTKLAEGTKTFRQTASDLSVPNPEGADPDHSNIDRIFHYAVLREKSSGKKILVVNTHLHYGGTGNGHEADDKLRRYEIRALLAWLETQRATYPDQIVMGDMNSHYKGGQGKVSMDLFADAGFERTNSSAVAEVRDDVGGTLAEQGRTTRPQWIFDYILVKGNIDTAYYTVVDNKIDNGGTTYPSDHVPVLAKIYLR